MNPCASVAFDEQRPNPPMPTTLRGQFGNPTGWVGRWVGLLMAVKNSERSRFVLSQLGLLPPMRVLEIGFGPGVDVARMAKVVSRGCVAGVDHSAAMLEMAARRNARAIRLGRVNLRQGSATSLPFETGAFDRVVSINCVQFWEDLAAGLCEAKRVLASGGLAAIAIQPREARASAVTSEQWGERLRTAMLAVGFDEVRVMSKLMTPVPTVCVLGVRH